MWYGRIAVTFSKTTQTKYENQEENNIAHNNECYNFNAWSIIISIPRHSRSHVRREIISEHQCDYILTESLKDRYSSKDLIHCLNSKIKAESEPLGFCLNFPLATTQVKTHKLLQTCKQVVTSLFTSG